MQCVVNTITDYSLCVPASEEVVKNNVPLMLYSSFCSLVYGMVPFLNAIMGTMLPMLSMAKQDNMKWVFSSGKSLPEVWEALNTNCSYSPS